MSRGAPGLSGRRGIFQIFEQNTELQIAGSGKIVSDDVK
jgi:hypothetical protein